jgi:hypothetical protein
MLITPAVSQSADQAKAQQKRQEHHRQLYPEYRTGAKLSDLASQQRSDIHVSKTQPIGLRGGLLNAPAYPSQFLRALSCESSIVVIGTMTEGSSQITENGEFVYTDHVFRISEVLKLTDGVALEPGSEILVTRPGGTVVIDGKRVQASDPNFPPFQPGRRYLLYLRYLPTSDSYKAGPEYSFALIHGRARVLTVHPLIDLSRHTELTFVTEASQAAALGCGN